MSRLVKRSGEPALVLACCARPCCSGLCVLKWDPERLWLLPALWELFGAAPGLAGCPWSPVPPPCPVPGAPHPWAAPGSGRLAALSLPGLLALCSGAGVPEGWGPCRSAGSGSERSGPAGSVTCAKGRCWPWPCPRAGASRRSEPNCFPGIAFPREEYLGSERGNCCFCV